MSHSPLTNLTWPRLQPAFERALHSRVIGRQMGVFPVAENLIVHGKTVEGWLYSGSEPKASAWIRLCEFFGPDFENEILEGGGAADLATRSFSLHELIELQRMLSGAADHIAETIGTQTAQVIDLKERA